MVDTVTTEGRAISKRSHKFGALYTAVIFLSLHWALVMYVNSTFLEQYVSSTVVGILYVGSAIFTVILFFSMSKILSRTGKHALVLLLAVIEMVVMAGLGLFHDPALLVTLFVIHETIVPLIFFNLDIYMEEMIGKQESSTGTKRGLLLTLMSITWAGTALAAGYLIGNGNPQFSYVYLASAALVVPFIFIMATQFKDKKDSLKKISFNSHVLVTSWKKKDLRNVFGAHFLLQVFFAWMVIYSPLHLATQVGLNWIQIGQVLFVGLLAYAIFEYPIGIITDKWLGEKELMALGFLIVAISTSWFVFIESTSVIPWMIILFVARFGASLLEVTTESYFFKHAKGSDTDMIGFFRATRPLSYVVGAGLGSLILAFFNFNIMFLVLAALMVPGFFFAMALHDTK